MLGVVERQHIWAAVSIVVLAPASLGAGQRDAQCTLGLESVRMDPPIPHHVHAHDFDPSTGRAYGNFSAS